MLQVLCNRASDGARKLRTGLREAGVPVTGFPSRATRTVCWGADGPEGALNARPPVDKLAELITIGDNDVPHVPFMVPPLGFTPEGDDWHGRRRNHQGGTDLRQPPTSPDYYVRRLPLVREFRIHVFRGVGGLQSIRAALKVGGNGWIRNHEDGWRYDYGDACQAVLRQSHRDLAKNAVAALGLDFGAVDIGVLGDDALRAGDYPHPAVVLEVNTAPGLDNDNTAAAYVRKIKEWYEEREART